MGKVLKFPVKDKDLESAQKLVNVGAEIDQILYKALAEDLNPKEVAGVLSHRLGSLIHLVDEKSELWPICERVLKRQADLD